MPTYNSAVGALATGIQAYIAGNGDLTPTTFSAVTTWTPNVQINAVSTGITYTSHTGFYQQFGSIVFITANIVLSSKGSQSGIVTISNLPVTPGTNAATNVIPCTFAVSTLTTGYTDMYLQLSSSTPVADFMQYGSNEANASVTAAILANTSSFTFSGFYFTN
jgi:hypothetical protein